MLRGINSSIGSPNTIYVGFGGSSVTLTAQVSSSLSPNSYTYKWTTGSPAGPGFATTQSITVSPSATTTYFLSVKDANNCSPTTQVSKQINVVDLRCGADKIYVCQFKKGSYNTVCISSAPKTINGLPAGSYLGACNSALTKSGGQIPIEESPVNVPDKKRKALDLTVSASPNPSNTNFRIAINSNNQKDPIQLQIADILGRVIETRTANAGQIIKLGDEYRSGVYVVRIIQGKASKQLKLIKLPD